MATIIKHLTITLILVFSVVISFSQNRISGFVKDAQTGELLIGATLVEPNTNNGVATNTNGYFSLLAEKRIIQVSFIGYETQNLSFLRDTVIEISLVPGKELGEIKVYGQNHSQFNTTTLTPQQMLTIPALGGKPDVMKTLQLMPGIQSQAEGTSLLNVRGGNPGENLYLLDNVPLLYVNHLGGFMSVFNPDMINGMEVYKGGFPAKYGGKLSSVMAITQREGNNKQWKGNLGIGVTDASFCVEGPLIEDKASLIITGRKTLIDPFMMLASALSGGGDYVVFYGFHDLNTKVTYRPDTKNSFHLNFYQGDDYVKFWGKKQRATGEKAKMNNAWGNWMLAGRWSRVIDARLFVNNILSVTNYRLKVEQSFTSNTKNDSIDYKGSYLSRVKDLSLRSDWQFKAAQNYDLEFGFQSTYYNHIPNKIENTNSTVHFDYETIHSFENAIYLDNKLTLFQFLDVDLGIRAVNFMNNGFSSFDWEPRLNIVGRIGQNHSINIAGQKVNQFAHLLFTSGAIMNNEIWVPADKNLTPSQSLQYSVGWKGSYDKGMFDSEINVYYKTLKNLATYKEGYSNLLGDGGWRKKIETDGQGESKGVEFLLRKNQGDWTGFIAYTFSKTTRQFVGINHGDEYVFDYDRPHSFSLNVSRKLSEKWYASASWVYNSGLPYTPVIGRQIYPDPEWGLQERLIYGERNSERMKDYHRLDLGFQCKKITRRGRKSIWNFSVYNAYNRSNPNAYIYNDNTKYSNKEEDVYKPIKLYQISFFPIIPTVSYILYFE